MPTGSRTIVATGAIAGLLFFLHALLPKSFLFPLVWPFLAGGLVVYRVAQAGSDVRLTHRRLALAAEAGFVSGLVFFLFGIGALYLESRMPHAATIGTISRVVQAPVERTDVVNTAIVAIVAIPLVAIIGGTLALRLHGASHSQNA